MHILKAHKELDSLDLSSSEDEPQVEAKEERKSSLGASMSLDLTRAKNLQQIIAKSSEPNGGAN